MKSIRIRLIISFSMLILISTMALGAISLVNAQRSLTKEAESTLSSLVKEGAMLMQSRLDIEIRTLEMIALNESMKGMNWDIQRRMLKLEASSIEFLMLGVVDTNGQAKYIDDSTSDLSERDYIKKALAGEANVSDVIISSVTGEPVVMVAVPIHNNKGEVVGALIGRKDGNALSDMVADTGYGKNGYGYIANRQGVIMAHPQKDMVLNQYSPIEDAKINASMKSTAALFERMMQSDAGVDSYTYKGNELYAAYHNIGGTNWIMVITAQKQEVLESVTQLKELMFLLIPGIFLLSIASVFIIGTSIVRPITRTVKHAGEIAALNLTSDVGNKYLKRKDEIGVLARSLQDITESMRQIIGEVSHSSEQLAAASEELTATTELSANTAEEIANTVTEIARGAVDQAEYTQKGAEKAERMGTVIDEDQLYLQDMNEATQEVGAVVKRGMKDISYLSEKTEENNQASRQIYEVVMKTDESSQKIARASSVIASIADETNLLALNAAIEAARAGESGKGFAVVAEEIRKLAEQSAGSTREIDQMVAELLANSKEAVETITMMMEVIQRQTESVNQNKVNYKDIETRINNAENAVGRLNASQTQMQSMKTEIMDALQNLSAIAEENSASTEEVTASMEEQTASVQEIANSSEELARLAGDLQEIIKRFRL